jgi:hypothetical protein
MLLLVGAAIGVGAMVITLKRSRASSPRQRAAVAAAWFIVALLAPIVLFVVFGTLTRQSAPRPQVLLPSSLLAAGHSYARIAA